MDILRYNRNLNSSCNLLLSSASYNTIMTCTSLPLQEIKTIESCMKCHSMVRITKTPGDYYFSVRSLTCCQVSSWLQSWSISAAFLLRLIENIWGETKFSTTKCCKKGCPYHQVRELLWGDNLTSSQPPDWHYDHGKLQWILPQRYSWPILWYSQILLLTFRGWY